MKITTVFICIILLGLTTKVQGQEKPPVPPPAHEKEDIPVVFTEILPKPIGGEEALLKHLAKNIKYPKKARRAGVEGIVYVQFLVKKDGTVTDFEVAKGLGYGLDEEAVRVVRTYPKGWKPCLQNGRPAEVLTTLPVKFNLGNGPKKKAKEEEIIPK